MALPQKVRQLTIVIHQAKADDQDYWYNAVRTYDPPPEKFVVSVEPYNDKPGHHCHIFVVFKNTVSWSRLLKTIQDKQEGHIENRFPAPPGKSLGHVKMKKMMGTLAQATAYLTQETTSKDKVCGIPKQYKNGITCTACSQVLPLWMMYTNSPRKTGQCKVCWAKFELQEIYSRQYSCYLEFKNTLDDFQELLDKMGFPQEA